MGWGKNQLHISTTTWCCHQSWKTCCRQLCQLKSRAYLVRRTNSVALLWIWLNVVERHDQCATWWTGPASCTVNGLPTTSKQGKFYQGMLLFSVLLPKVGIIWYVNIVIYWLVVYIAQTYSLVYLLWDLLTVFSWLKEGKFFIIWDMVTYWYYCWLGISDL